MFTVMTWNVENLYRPGSKYGPRSPEAYAAKLAGLAEVIEAAAPDAIALQEVGEEAALDDLVDRLPGAWHRSVSAHPDGRGIRVAWLCRGPLTSARDILAFPDPWPPVQVDDAGTRISAMGRGACLRPRPGRGRLRCLNTVLTVGRGSRAWSGTPDSVS